MTKATKTKAIQANKPTEEKFLTSKDLASMAKVEPGQLRRCLRTHFSGRITTVKGDNGIKTYHISAKDPIVEEILAKLKGNSDKGKATKPAKAQVDKGAGEEPAPESLDHIETFDALHGGQDSREKMGKLVAQAESTPESSNYSGWDSFSPEPDFNINSSIALTQSNKPEVVGSNPTPATKEIAGPKC